MGGIMGVTMIKQTISNRYHKALDTIKQNRLYYIFGLLVVLSAGIFAAMMIRRTMPFAEGWYTYYSQCIESGLLPYRDFEYLYSPLYIYTIFILTRIFGYDLIALRVVGILFFALIALGMYLSITVIVGKKKSWIALVASLIATFYMQTEIVQIFYDYVRMMDVIAVFSLYFLLKSVRAILERTSARKSLVALGLLLALFANIKQNTGVIFTVYSFVLLVYVSLYVRNNWKELLKTLAAVLAPLAAVTLLIYGVIFLSGALGSYLSMTGLSAASAKGGISAILFGWIINNKNAIIDSIPVGVFSIILMVGLYLARYFVEKKNISLPFGKGTKLPTYLLGFLFAIVLVAGLFALKFSKAFALWLNPVKYWSPYAIFLSVFPLFLVCGVWGIVDMLRKKQTMEKVFLLFSLAGAYFAIAFACGNSGGLAEGQATFGVAMIVTTILLLLDSLKLRLGQAVAVALCIVLTLQCAGKKMIATYNWWGMDESDYWASTETMDVPLLDGILVSAETKAVYESVYQLIVENTEKDDPIFCFPQIPLFYSICDRTDPGTFTKVQWFDVSTDRSVKADIEVLKKNPPKAILIYNTSDGAYLGHENAFRGGNASGTRIMREFLYNFVSDEGYRYCGRYYANNNSLSLWILEDSTESETVNFERGSGTVYDPYVIATPEQLQYFQYMVSAGRTFAGQYIVQTADIDMEGYEFSPIGNDRDGTYFGGVYNGGKYTIRNIRFSNEEDEGKTFLGSFRGGQIYHLNFENCPFETVFPQQ